jgi:hypothetical protein
VEIYDYIEETKYRSAPLLTSDHAELVPATDIPEPGSVAKLMERGIIPTTSVLRTLANLEEITMALPQHIRVPVQQINTVSNDRFRCAANALI